MNKRKPSKINYTIKLSHNDNINNGTYADTVKLFGVPFKIDENAKAKSSFELFTNINGYKNNYLYGQKINTGFDISFSDFKDDDYDRLRYNINFGPEFQIQNKMIILNYNLSQEKIGFNKVLNDNKLEMKSILNNKNSQFIYSLGVDKKRFYSKEVYNTNGKFAKISSNFFVNNRFTLGGAYKYSTNDAINNYYSNEKNYYELFSSIRLFKNFLIDALTGVEFSDYHEYQPLFSKTRKDKLKFINIDFKNDKIFIGKYMPQISFTQRENKSNVNVYQTNSNNISLYFVKEF